MRPLTTIWVIPSILVLSCLAVVAKGQSYPEPAVDQSFCPPSPNAQAIGTYGNEPVALYEGTPAISIPIYTVKCGSLSLPISLSYNYNGLFPLQDASWVGLGWNLNAGGCVTRMVEGGVDESENSGYNYDQYNLHDTVFNSTDLSNFLGLAYNNNLGNPGKAYDLAPDIFDAEFNGYSNKFVWASNHYVLSRYDKDFSVSWPNATHLITITTADGVMYTFGAMETTTNYYYGGADSTTQTFTSAWYLTQVVSPDYLDTIQLNYSNYTWTQAQVSYQSSYVESTGTQVDLGSDPTAFLVTPSVQTKVLQSITCRNTRVNFIPDGTTRTDIIGTNPRLREIDVIDSLTGSLIKKNTLSYLYFGQTGTNPANYERLALKSLSSTNTLISADSLTYSFRYIADTGAWPSKSTAGIDYWGFYHGGSISGLLPTSTTAAAYYLPTPLNTIGQGSRTPNFAYSSMGALDTIVYPTGGYTAFKYQQNQFYNSSLGGNIAGPGICVQSTTTVSNNPTSPQPIVKNYSYLADNGSSSSGAIGNLPSYIGNPFVEVNTNGTYAYRLYSASANSGGVGGTAAQFYYTKVSETISANGETHRSDHYFTSFPELSLDVRQTQQIDYLHTVNTNTFTPITKTTTSYSSSFDTAFITAYPEIDTEYVNPEHNPKIWYSFQDRYSYWNMSYWIRPTSQTTYQYDQDNDTMVNTLVYTYNPTTRNLANVTQTTSDGQTIKQKFKYPEDYSSSVEGALVSERILKPVIEKQTWLYRDASDSVLINGTITQIDPISCQPNITYALETTKPLPVLNNETTSGGLYTTLLSDSRYVMKAQMQYDGNHNLSTAAKNADMNTSYIWDYRHSQPVATVKNALPADIAYTSFEADGGGGWTIGSTVRDGSHAATGTQAYNLSYGAVTHPGLNSATTYIVSFWNYAGSGPSIAGSTGVVVGKTINNWTYLEYTVTGVTTASVSGNGDIDELRLYPKNAQMTTFTYQPSVGMSSQCDADSRITYYQYDGFNRVKVVFDQDHNIIKTMQYHIKGETIE